MQPLRRWIRIVFGFSRTETNGFLILLPLMAIMLFSLPAHRWYRSTFVRDDHPGETALLDSIFLNWDAGLPDSTSGDGQENKQRTLYRFNPNTATRESLTELGFAESAIRSIINYRKKGGTFKTKSDLGKIYTLDTTFFHHIQSFIDLPDKGGNTKIKKAVHFTLFDLNLADTLTLKGVNGIGTVLSKRIIKYRERLGGFISKMQLHEVYGLDSAVVLRISDQSFIAENYQPQMINLNEADERQLSAHPYISMSMAKTIVAYRFQHGKFQSIEDLRLNYVVQDEIVSKIKPYLTVTNEQQH